MTKLLTVLLVVAAFGAALWFVFIRRCGPAGTGRFATLVAAWVALLGGCDQAPKAQAPAEPAKPTIVETKQEPPVASKPPTQPKTTREQIRAELVGIAKLKGGPGGPPKAMQAGRERLGELLAPQVEAGALSKAAAAVLIDAHADRIYHHLRKQATCYMVYPRIATRRDGVEKQLALLTDAEKRGTLTPEVIAKSKLALGRGMELILNSQAISKRQAADPKAKVTKAEQELLDILNRGPKPMAEEDRIQVRPEVAEARDWLVALLSE